MSDTGGQEGDGGVTDSSKPSKTPILYFIIILH